jgi:hypothetical protein
VRLATVAIGVLTLALAGCQPPAAPHAGHGRTPESARDDALTAARVWRPPAVPIPDASLSQNPSGTGALISGDEVSCTFVETAVSGTTPKFSCRLTSGEIVKVKYGASNPERIAEVMATRLLATLGFGADHMFVVGRVRCAGCPPLPFAAARCLGRFGWRAFCFAGTDASQTVIFDGAVVERRAAGDAIEAYDGQGWAWHELDRIDPARGGATRAEVDALRLVAMLLAHWDNKSENQRLVCPAEASKKNGICAAPVAIIQDLGATFGPLKLDLVNWRRVSVWSNRARCEVSMRALPYAGATFEDRRISDAGRRLLVDLLDQLSDLQLRDLFTSSGVTAYEHLTAEGRDASAWVRAFKGKVREIREGGPCDR